MAQLNKAKLFANVGYKPHAGQLEVHSSTAKRRVVACGVRWGKTTSAMHEALAALLAPTGQSRGWIVSPSFDTTDLLVKKLFHLLETRFAHRIVDLDVRRRRVTVMNLAGNLAELAAKSATRKETLLGESLDWCIVDEAARLKADVWREHLSQRLVDRDGWALLAATPKEAGDWFNEEFDRGESDDGYDAWTRPTWENPAVDESVVEREKERLSIEEFYTVYGGEFIGPGGRVCPRCRWGEHANGRMLSEEQWMRCSACPECGRPINENGEPVGIPMLDGGVYVPVVRVAGGVTECQIHIDPELRAAMIAGGFEAGTA